MPGSDIQRRRPDDWSKETGGGDVSIPVTRGSQRTRAFATLAAVLILLSPVAILISPGSGADTADPNPHVVEYHPGAPSVSGDFNETYDPGIRQVTYYGDVISTEYNPQVWDYSNNWYEIKKYVVDKTVVFTGWKLATGVDNGNYALSDDTIYPGEVLTEQQIEQHTLSDNKIHIFATWGILNAYVDAFSSANTSSFADGTVYTNFVFIHAEANLGNLPNDCSYPFTIRSVDKSNGVMEPATAIKRVNIGERSDLRTDTIIDSVELWMTKNDNSNHGDSSNGIFANGHTLIIGDGVSTGGNLNTAAAGALKYPQIFGGSHSSWIPSTNVIIHSGVYSNVIAGSYGTVGITGDLKLVLSGGAVLDTVVGGSSGGASFIQGSTYIYILGDAILPGDTYEENALGSERWIALDNILDIDIEESSILTGGSNGNTSESIATVKGDTHIHISGEAEVWDAQGPGRRAASQVDGTAHVLVSGKAWVKHMVAGSITDGNNWKDMSCVGGTDMVVKDDATVASVFGAGYDTWANPTNVSMMGESTTINVKIMGGTVGYVYGGGYRGTVGTPESPIGSITISITGGTILGDVFGGGRGGLDKIIHTADGEFKNGSGYTNSTGSSVVYAEKVSVTVSGNAVVNGNVYGGGESTPVITDYKSMSSNNSPTGVAMVVCDSISVSISDTASVNGDVYGAGKGIDVNDTTGGIHSSAYIFSIKKTDDVWGIERIPWINDSDVILTTDSNFNYSDYAHLKSTSASVHVSSNVLGSVYGAGAYGQATINQNLFVTVSGTVEGNVHGGALGSSEGSEINDKPMVSGTRYVTVVGEADVGGSVYGGSRNASATGDNHVLLISGRIEGNAFGGPFMGSLNGNSHVYVGDYAYDLALDLGIIQERSYEDLLKIGITVGIGIYGGGDVGDPTNPDLSNTVTIQGSSEVLIGKEVLVNDEVDYGQNGFGSGGYQYIPVSTGTIAGAGNAGTIGGESTVTVSGIKIGADGSLYSIQRSNNLNLICAEVTLQGEYDGKVSGPSERWSISSTKEMRMTDSIIHMESQAGSIESLEIDDTSGVRSRLCLHNGSVMYIHDSQSAMNIDGEGVFLKVEEGDTYYGAYVVYRDGNVVGENDYLILHEGVYYHSEDSKYDPSDVSVTPQKATNSLGLTCNGTFYWRAGPQMDLWISASDITISKSDDANVAQVNGTVAVESILVLEETGEVQGIFSDSDTVQIPVSEGNRLAFLQATLAPNSAESGMAISDTLSGSDISGSITLNGKSFDGSDFGWIIDDKTLTGLNLTTSGAIYTNEIGISGIIPVEVDLQSLATDLPLGTVAILTIHLMETREVEITVGEDDSAVKQTIVSPVKYIDIRIEVVISKSTGAEDIADSIEVDLISGTGTSKVVLPAMLGGARDVYVKEFNLPEWVESVSISTSRNYNGSYGWSGGFNTVVIDGTSKAFPYPLGEYTGIRDVAVDVTVKVKSGYQDTEDSSFDIPMGSTMRTLDLTVKVVDPGNVTVRLFIPVFTEGESAPAYYTLKETMPIPYGSVPDLDDDNLIAGVEGVFLGWRLADSIVPNGDQYHLRDTMVPFDYSQQVTGNIDLVAAFSYSVVTFDPQGGIATYTQLDNLAPGANVILPDCKRSGGFKFVGWRIAGEDSDTYGAGTKYPVTSGTTQFVAIWSVELEGWTGTTEKHQQVLISEKDWENDKYTFKVNLLPDGRMYFGSEYLAASILQTDGSYAAWVLHWPEGHVGMDLSSDGDCTISFSDGPGTGHFRVSVSATYVATSENHSNLVYTTVEWQIDVYVIPDQI